MHVLKSDAGEKGRDETLPRSVVEQARVFAGLAAKIALRCG
jgi:hypothetical protein